MKELRLYKDSEGKTQATLAESERLEDELCDFCSGQRRPYRVYKCKDFAYETMPQLNSTGDWNACPECAALIDANDREGLVQRCSLILDMDGMPGSIDGLRKLHEQFFNNRI